MNYWWCEFERFFWWAGTPEGAVFVLAMSVAGGLITGVILIAIKVVWSIPRVWRQVLAEDRAKRLAKQGLPPGDSHPAPPAIDVPPTSDI